MVELNGKEIRQLKVGDKVLYKYDDDEVDCVYSAEVKNIYPYQIELECFPIVESIAGWPVWEHLCKPHTECVAFADNCEYRHTHIYLGEYVPSQNIRKARRMTLEDRLVEQRSKLDALTAVAKEIGEA